MKIYLSKLTFEDAQRLLEFELTNRRFFELMVPTRGDDYYKLDQFLINHQVLLNEQEEGLSTFYLIKNEIAGIVGRINLIDINKQLGTAHLGYRIGEAFLGKGIATQSVKLILELIEEQSIHQLYAKTTMDNIASQKVLERTGFLKEHSLKEDQFTYYYFTSKVK